MLTIIPALYEYAGSVDRHIMSYSTISTLYAGYIVSVHRIVMENRPVDPGSIQGSQRPTAAYPS